MRVPKPNQNSGPLAGHVRKGRVFEPPLTATGTLILESWIKVDFPDLLWPALVLAEQGNNSYRQFVKWQKAIQQALAHHGEAVFVAESLDGRLSHLAALAVKFPDASETVVEEANRNGLLSESVRKALASFPKLPANWLVGDLQLEPPSREGLTLIRDALISASQDNHREALLKCFRIWSTVQAGTFSSNQSTINLLKDYPDNLENRGISDSAVRSMWGAHKAAIRAGEPDHFNVAEDWARVFWQVNSMTSRCVRKRDIESNVDSPADPDKEKPDEKAGASTLSDGAQPTRMPERGENLRQFTMDLLSSFVEALETSPANLYANERQEVVAGLVVRAGRDLVAVLSAPDLWCLEHGAHIGRMLVETKIYLHWMAKQDPAVYRQFQEYGAGKAKLYAGILDEIPVERRSSGFGGMTDELRRLSRNHDLFDFRTVDTRDTFADGKSIRSMATEAGLLDLYRHAYSLSSGVTHSEWWSVEVHAMEPCLNILHGMHLIPSLSLNSGGNVELAMSWIDQLYEIIRTGLSILGTHNDAVQAAFAWMADVDDLSETDGDEDLQS